jgi:hypothetical protein
MIIVAAAAELGPLADLTITPGCGVVLVVVGGTLEVSNISYDYMMCAGEKEDRATAYGVRTLWPGLVWSGLVWRERVVL